MALLGLSGFLVLVGLGLTLLWGGEASSGVEAAADGSGTGAPDIVRAEALGPLRDYEVINARPVFNETRRPMAASLELAGDEDEPEVELAVADPPRVRLTGVVITPTERVVTLTPEDGGEAVVIREGMPLEGKFVGWSVDSVEPRRVNLLSSDGDEVHVELAVHDAMIAQPPEPEPRRAVDEEADFEAGDDVPPDETRSRADEIRERIRERREQLRAEAEAAEAEEEGDQAATRNAYQDAIRSLMRTNRENRESAGSGETGDEEDSGDE